MDDLAGSLPHLVEIEPLTPYDKNARTHSREQLDQIKDSIRRFGFVGVLGYDSDGLAIGHGRRQAAMEMWADGEIVFGPGKRQALPEGHLPAVDITGLEDAERRALIIADNKLALNAGWDDDLLREEMLALSEANFDLPVIGFDAKELDKLFAGIRRGTADPDIIPDKPREATTRSGDLWLLGSHRLLCGDSTDAACVDRVLDGKCKLTLTDPPYGIGYEYGSHDDSDNQANADLVAKVFALAPSGKVWTPGLHNLARDISRFGESKQAFWHKGFAAAGNGMGGASTVEPILIIDPPRKGLKNDYIRIGTDRLEVEGQSLRDLHPCPKPVELYALLAEAFAPRGHAVYEPFGGSGTTLIACEQTERKCRAIEIDPAYVDVIVLRWQEFTGQEARLDGDGRSFAEIRADRAAG
jgi:ParB-like chromosome segregation protein Spo0J